MFNIGLPELTIIFVAALLLLGPKQLPEFARWVGKALRDLRRATNDIKATIDFELEREEFERLQEEFKGMVDPSLDELMSEPAPDIIPSPPEVGDDALHTTTVDNPDLDMEVQPTEESIQESHDVPGDTGDASSEDDDSKEKPTLPTEPPPDTISRNAASFDDDDDEPISFVSHGVNQETTTDDDTSTNNADVQPQDDASNLTS
jgi:Tat protein translocase TatB subunit